jgi:hypothetical protein
MRLKMPLFKATVGRRANCGSSRAAEEIDMKTLWVVIAVAALGVIAADPALARARHKARPHCVDRPFEFSWRGLLFNPPPQPNGCAPPVYAYGKYVGQDPDPNIRHQLLRDPATGYSAHTN